MRSKLENGQFDFLSKISEGIAYCKILLDTEGKPVDWVYLEVNEAYEKINGIKKADVIGKKATEVLPTVRSDLAYWITLYGKVALTGEPVTMERYADVRKKWYHISAYSPEKGYFIAVFEDISERKQAEETIRLSEERFSKAFNQSPVALIITRLSDGRYVDVNEAFQRIFGYKRNEVIDRTSGEINIFLEGRAAFVALINKEGTIHNQEMAFRAKNGTIVPTLLSTEKLTINGEDHLLTSLIDITERKKAEHALKESVEKERFLAELVRNASVAVGVGYPDGRLGMINQAFEKLTGYTAEELHRLNWSTVLTPPEYKK
jgi:PAS domain S-box-containing protein